MSNPFRDQLKKANLLSDKHAKRLAHEERVKRKKVSREDAEKADAEHKQELQQKQDAQRKADRKQQAALEKEKAEHAELAACRALLENEARRPAAGSVQFFFETPEGDLPWLEVSPQELHQLRGGQLAIVRPDPKAHVYKVMAPEHAQRVAAHFPEVIVRG